MANPVNQFYYVQGGKPILKTEYDDGSEDFYDASGQFDGYSWGNLGDGTVIDPFGDAASMAAMNAQQQATQQRNQQDPLGMLGRSFNNRSTTVANPLTAPKPKPNYLDPNPEATPEAMTQNNPTPPPAPQTPPPPQPGQSPVGTDEDQLRNYYLYNYMADPRSALQTVLQNKGWSTYNNPFAARLLNAAPGLATSFLAGRGLSGGAISQDVAGSYGAFGDFLKNAVGGGQVLNTLLGSQRLMPNLIQAIRQHDQTAATNPAGAGGANPFLTALSTMFGQNMGQGALNAQAGMYTPFMAPSMLQGYQGILQQRGNVGRSNFLQSGNLKTPTYGGNDYWKYLFGY